MRPAPRHLPQQRTKAQIKTELTAFLYQCRAHVLAALTLDDLCRRYSKLDRREVEYALTIAKQQRSGEMAGG